MEYRSEQLNELFTALAKAQLEMEAANKSADNPFFKSKYADLEEVVKASRPYVAKHGLCVAQPIIKDSNGIPDLHTILGHSSGQWMKSVVALTPPKSDIQSFGSYVTYQRRYSYASIIGVVTTDDDGEEAMKEHRNQTQQQKQISVVIQKPVEYISDVQIQEIEYALNGYPEIAKKVFAWFKTDDLSKIPADKYRLTLNEIDKIKRNS